MEQKIKRNLAIINMVSDFEEMCSAGENIYLTEKSFLDIIEYYQDENQYDKAISVADLAIIQFNYRAEFYICKAKLLSRMNKPKECIKVLNIAEKIAPFELEIKLIKIKIFAYSGKVEEALSILDELSSYVTAIDKSEVLISESYIHEVNQDYNAMYEVLKDAIILDPSNEEALDRFWFSIEFSKNYYGAISFLNKVLDETPYSYMAWYNLGEAYSCVGEYEKAIFALEYAFIIKEDFQNAYFECAELCLQVKKFSKALSIYNEAINLFGIDEDILLNIADCHRELGNLSAAKYNLYKALKYDPYNDEVYFKLGLCYTLEKNWNNAIKSFHKAIAIEENTEEYFLELAEAYYTLGSYEKADFFYRKATTIAPEESHYWAKYATFLIKTGEKKLALQLLEKAEDFTFGANILYCKAAALLLNNENGAVEVLEEALKEEYHTHKILFDIEPELALDKNIVAMIDYYKRETQGQ